jgi:hypothetical protein
MSRNLEQESIDLCRALLEKHTYSFHLFRRIFQKKIADSDEMIDYWYDNGNFKNMRLYKYITRLGYRKIGTVLKKVKEEETEPAT